MKKRRSFLHNYSGEDLRPLSKGMHRVTISKIGYVKPRNAKILKITVTADEMAKNRDQVLEMKTLSEMEIESTGKVIDFLKNLWGAVGNSIQYTLDDEDSAEYEDLSHMIEFLCLGEFENPQKLVGSKMYVYHRPQTKWRRPLPVSFAANLDQYSGVRDKGLLKAVSSEMRCDLVSLYHDQVWYVNCTKIEKNYPIPKSKFDGVETEENQEEEVIPEVRLSLVANGNSWDDFK